MPCVGLAVGPVIASPLTVIHGPEASISWMSTCLIPSLEGCDTGWEMWERILPNGSAMILCVGTVRDEVGSWEVFVRTLTML